MLSGIHKEFKTGLRLSQGSTLILVGSGLKFSKEDLNMAAINFSPLQNLKWLKIRYKYIKQPPEVVFWVLLHVYKDSHCKMVFDQRYYMSNKEHICHQ